MKRVTLELGGKSPTILLDDAVLDKVIPSALIMAFMNSGQACAAGSQPSWSNSLSQVATRGVSLKIELQSKLDLPRGRKNCGSFCMIR
jgi:hypothetical protein